MSSYRALAGNHDFTVLWVGQTVSELGSRISTFVFPLVTYALTGSALAAAAAEAVFLLGMAASLLPAGVLADRVDRRRLMRTSSATGVLLYASLVAAGLAGALTVAHVLVVALLTGAAAGLFAPAEISAIRTVVPTDDLPTALAQNNARQHVAGLVGAPLGGVLYAVARWLPFAVDAASFAVSWLMLGRIRSDLSAPGTPSRKRPRQDLAEGIRFIAASPLFRVITVWSALANLAVNALFFAAVLRMIEAGVPAVQIGLVETAAGVCGILGALVAPTLIDRLPTGRLTVAVAWSFVPLVVPMALWNHPAVVAGALSFGLFLNPAGNAGIGSYRIAVTPASLQGRVQSSMQFVSMSAMPLAPVLAGALLAVLGGGTAIAVLGAMCAAVALIPSLSASVRSVPRPRDWPARGAVAGEPTPAL